VVLRITWLQKSAIEEYSIECNLNTKPLLPYAGTPAGGWIHTLEGLLWWHQHYVYHLCFNGCFRVTFAWVTFAWVEFARIKFAWVEFAWVEFAWVEFAWVEFAWVEFAWVEFAWVEFAWIPLTCIDTTVAKIQNEWNAIHVRNKKK